MSGISVLVPSIGRPSLSHTIDSIIAQLLPGDELIVCVDREAPWGHKSRNRMMQWARGSHLAFMDDDDVYLPGAFDAIRRAIRLEPDHVHLFQMRYQRGETLWATPEVKLGNVSTQMVIVPNPPLAEWRNVYEGDFFFIAETCESHDVTWHEEVIAQVRPYTSNP